MLNNSLPGGSLLVPIVKMCGKLWKNKFTMGTRGSQSDMSSHKRPGTLYCVT